jgi:LysM repeat protein
MSRRNLIVAVVAAHLCVLAILALMGGCALEKKEPKLTAAAPVQDVRAPEGEPESILEPKGMAEEKDLLVSREPEMVPAAAADATPAPPTPVPFVEEKAGAEKAAAPEVPAAMAAPSGAPAGGTHKVAPGESLWKIARTYRVTVADLARENNLKTDARVKAGQTLVIPAAAQKSAAPSAAVKAETQAQPAVKAPEQPAAAAAKPLERPVIRKPPPRPAEVKPAAAKAEAPRVAPGAPQQAPAGAVRRHVVKKGETLSLIAKHYGVSMRKIMAANKIKDAGKIRSGMVLTIPQ